MDLSLIDWIAGSQNNRESFFFRAMSQIHISMAAIDLNTGKSVLLDSKYDKEIIGQEMEWESLLKLHFADRIFPEDRGKVNALLSMSGLNLFLNSDVNERCVEARFMQSGSDTYEWVEAAAFIFDCEARQILVAVRNISQVKMQKRVFDQFLYYQNSDFFIVVNLPKNNYEFLDVRTGLLPIPELRCDDYTAEMIEYNSKYIVKSDVERVISTMMPDKVRELLACQDEYSFTTGMLTDSGEYRRAKMQFIMLDRTRELVIMCRSDITEIYLEDKSRNEQLIRALRDARRDKLTGLYNQAATEEIISKMLEDYQGGLAAVLFIDVDNFKMVNDTYGHLHGNELLKMLGEFLKGYPTQECIAGRVGGDEFLIFVPAAASVSDIHGVGEQICSAFDSFKELTKGLPVSCSVGISLYPQDGLDYEELVRKADQALYQSKRYGKNHSSMYSEEMNMHKFSSAFSNID